MRKVPEREFGDLRVSAPAHAFAGVDPVVLLVVRFISTLVVAGRMGGARARGAMRLSAARLVDSAAASLRLALLCDASHKALLTQTGRDFAE